MSVIWGFQNQRTFWHPPRWRLAPLSAQSSAFAPSSRQADWLIEHPSTDSSCSGFEVRGLYLLGLMAHQLRLKRKDFDNLIDCPLTREAYIQMLINNGELKKYDSKISQNSLRYGD